jgi:Uncharacterized protein conserved in bacteria
MHGSLRSTPLDSMYVTRAILISLLVVPLMIFPTNVRGDERPASALGQFPIQSEMDRFYREVLEEEFVLSPTFASQLGDHRYDHLLDDVSEKGRLARREFRQKTLKRMETELQYDQLSRPVQIDYEILRDRLQLSLWIEENERPHERDPRNLTGFVTDSVYVLLTQSTLPLETNVTNAIARMKLIPKALAEGRQSLKNPPQVLTQTAIRQNKGAIEFFEDEVFLLMKDSPQIPAAREAAAEVVKALKEHQQFLENDLLPRSNGEWRLGKELFAEKAARTLGLGISAEEVLAEAEAGIANIQLQMAVISRQLWSQYFPGRPIPPDDEAGRRETIRAVLQHIGRQHGTPDELAKNAELTVEAIKKFITTNDILTLPDPDRCLIIEMPEFQRGNAVAFFDAAPPLDNTATSIYAISPPPASWSAQQVESFLQEYNREMMKILTIHEAYPGHYVQLEYANRNPSLVRRIIGSGIYAEGWACYTEQMMADQGFEADNLAFRMMQLKFLLRAAANAILDYRMHCSTMTDEEALNFLVNDAYQEEGEARLKVIRSKQSSTQLSSYFAGRLAFIRLRNQFQRELGDQFNLGRFHEAVLNAATVPVKYLPELTRMNLNATKSER